LQIDSGEGIENLLLVVLALGDKSIFYLWLLDKVLQIQQLAFSLALFFHLKLYQKLSSKKH
jgi:hypothetical protein